MHGDVDLWTANLPDGGGPKSGTSYAVPFVSAAAAVMRSLRPEMKAADTKSALYRSARDRGEPVRDPVYGWGLVQTGSLCAPPAKRPIVGDRAPAAAVKLAGE